MKKPCQDLGTQTRSLKILRFDLNLYTRGKVELAERIYCTAAGGINVQKTFVRAELELLTALLIHVW
jgi:hypothetical protein